MLIESEDLKHWIKNSMKPYVIHFSDGDHIMLDGIPYYKVLMEIDYMEKRAKESE